MNTILDFNCGLMGCDVVLMVVTNILEEHAMLIFCVHGDNMFLSNVYVTTHKSTTDSENLKARTILICYCNCQVPVPCSTFQGFIRIAYIRNLSCSLVEARTCTQLLLCLLLGEPPYQLKFEVFMAVKE